jgi:hypothetical protein
MELAAPELGPFKWKNDFYLPALVVLKEPCISYKIDVVELRRRLEDGELQRLGIPTNQTIFQYRNDLFQALERAQACGALLDEAHHMRRPATTDGIFGQYDSLKSRSNATRTHFCLLGAPELADILFQSGQISKRVRPIWLDPYRIDKKGDLKPYRSALNGLLEKLQGLEEFPIKVKFDINKHFDEIVRKTAGVFGAASDWAERVLIRCIATNKHSITWRDMLEQQLDEAQLQGIIGDVIAYREVRHEISEILETRMSLILLPPEETVATKQKIPRKKSARRKPGERNPCRDKVSA